EARAIVANDIIASVGSYDNGVVLSGMSQELRKEVKFHLKFDTDMARMGFNYDEVQKAIQVAKFLPGLKLCGVYANITSYECKSKKKAQLALTKFKTMLSLLKRDDIDCGLIHLAGTVGALKHPSLRLNAVRCGSALTGDIKIKDKWGFKKVSRLVCGITDIRWVPQKQKIGINNSYKTRKSTKIAIVDAGYIDGVGVGIINEPYKVGQGFSRIWKTILTTVRGRKTYCDINGKKARVIGRADLETLIVDVTKIGCKPGDIVSFEINPIFVNTKVERSYV
ncbi:MAG: alanine racemase, partial [Clostridia bacterium]